MISMHFRVKEPLKYNKKKATKINKNIINYICFLFHTCLFFEKFYSYVRKLICDFKSKLVDYS